MLPAWRERDLVLELSAVSTQFRCCCCSSRPQGFLEVLLPVALQNLTALILLISWESRCRLVLALI